MLCLPGLAFTNEYGRTLVLEVVVIKIESLIHSILRIQNDRGQTVVQDGPYLYMRHPGYASSLIANLAVPIMLGTLWALLPAIVIVIVLIIRTSKEDRTLQEELPGYREYAQQTRYRLIPGIW